MKYFYDTEFIEDGKTIDLISIGVVREDGRTFYAISTEFKAKRASQWVKDNVLIHLPERYATPPPYGSPNAFEKSMAWMDRKTIKADLLRFIGDDAPEWWGYYSAYDHVALCQIFGTMMDLPEGWPFYTRDLKQWADELGVDLSERVPQETEHHALADAQWNKKAYEYLVEISLPKFRQSAA